MEGLELIIGLLCFLGPLLVGYFVGGARERSHMRQLVEREQFVAGKMVITQSKHFLAPVSPTPTPAAIVTSEVVIASDYLKTFLARWRNIFGGEVVSYQRMLDRARREAILRLADQASQLGHNAIANVRLQFSDIGGNTSARPGAAMASIIASATAYTSAAVIRHETPAA